MFVRHPRMKKSPMNVWIPLMGRRHDCKFVDKVLMRRDKLNGRSGPAHLRDDVFTQYGLGPLHVVRCAKCVSKLRRRGANVYAVGGEHEASQPKFACELGENPAWPHACPELWLLHKLSSRRRTALRVGPQPDVVLVATSQARDARGSASTSPRNGKAEAEDETVAPDASSPPSQCYIGVNMHLITQRCPTFGDGSFLAGLPFPIVYCLLKWLSCGDADPAAFECLMADSGKLADHMKRLAHRLELMPLLSVMCQLLTQLQLAQLPTPKGGSSKAEQWLDVKKRHPHGHGHQLHVYLKGEEAVVDTIDDDIVRFRESQPNMRLIVHPTRGGSFHVDGHVCILALMGPRVREAIERAIRRPKRDNDDDDDDAFAFDDANDSYDGNGGVVRAIGDDGFAELMVAHVRDVGEMECEHVTALLHCCYDMTQFIPLFLRHYNWKPDRGVYGPRVLQNVLNGFGVRTGVDHWLSPLYDDCVALLSKQ